MALREDVKLELIEKINKSLVTPNVEKLFSTLTDEDLTLYNKFVNNVKAGKKNQTVTLPIDFAIKNDLFELIRSEKVFVVSSIKFVTTFSTNKPNIVKKKFDSSFVGHEFDYRFLDNHPGIINVDKLKDIPHDYEGFMAVPPTVLEYSNLVNFNVHRVIYNPVVNRKSIYPRVVVTLKCTL